MWLVKQTLMGSLLAPRPTFLALFVTLEVGGPLSIRNGKNNGTLGKSIASRPRHMDCAYLSGRTPLLHAA